MSVDGLRRLLETPRGLVLLDVRWKLGADDPRSDYAAGHIPGAIYVDLETELAGPANERQGRHPLPSPEDVERAAAGWGIRPDSVVVVYDDNAGMSAARAWWLLRWIGHERVQVLDGGLSAWRAAGGPLTDAEPQQHADVSPTVGDRGSMPTVGADDIAAGRVEVVLDARAGERFRGEQEPIDPVAGHIPGAISAPTTDNITADGRFRTAGELRERFDQFGIRPGTRVAVYCGSGVTAAHEILALELAGVRASLYPGSWSGWIADPDHEVATGQD
jgi:thiosulfate/3-mercaptopyruvate sulfurtransferase